MARPGRGKALELGKGGGDRPGWAAPVLHRLGRGRPVCPAETLQCTELEQPHRSHGIDPDLAMAAKLTLRAMSKGCFKVGKCSLGLHYHPSGCFWRSSKQTPRKQVERTREQAASPPRSRAAGAQGGGPRSYGTLRADLDPPYSLSLHHG